MFYNIKTIFWGSSILLNWTKNVPTFFLLFLYFPSLKGRKMRLFSALLLYYDYIFLLHITTDDQ